MAGVEGQALSGRPSSGPAPRKAFPHRRLPLLLTSACFAVTPANAADWLGTTSPDWFAPGNWSTNAVPSSSTVVNINNAAIPNPATINGPGAASGTVTLGSTAGQSGTLNVTGGGLAVNGSIYVGLLGSGTLNISGGTVSSTGLASVADSPNSSGTVTVSGAGTQFNPGQLYVAADVNTLGQVTIQNGASISTIQTILGYFTATANGALTVTNGSSASTGSMTIGERGTGTFNLNGGSSATSGFVSLGSSNATGSGTANIAGAGTIWTTGTANIGTIGTGALTISSGAKVTTTSSFAVIPAVSLGGSATVTGAGSQWDIVGNSGGSSQGVLGIGSKINATGTLTVSNGGKVTVRDSATTPNGQFMQLRMGIASGSTGSLTVTGANSSFTTPYDVWVAYNSGTTGNVTVSNGGALNTGYAILGASGTGNALVTGAGSVWTISDMPNVPGSQPQGLAIGSSSTSTGTLTIANGGTVNVNATGGSVVLGGAAGSQATLNIGAAAASPAASAGTLNATNVVFATGATGTVNFNHTSNNYVFAPGIQGAGPGTVNFLSGTTILTGNNTYVGATNISSGATAQLGNGGSMGLITGNIANNGALIFNNSSFPNYGGVISGSGTVEQRGPNTLTLTADNTYTGLTKISSGTLQLGNGGTTGSVAGNIENNSRLSFNRSNNFTFSNLISGTGDVDKNGSGTMTLASVQTYTGGTSVSQGTLRLGGNNRLVSTGSLFIFGGATFDLAGFSQTVGAFSGPGTAAIGTGSLTVGNALDRNFQGNLTGSGSFIKQGMGTLTMSGNSSTYTGTTTVTDGALIVTGNLANSATTANSGGILGGTGTTGATTVNGTIAPGLANAIGTLNVNGAYAQAASSFYNVNVNAAGASDLVNVTGAANLSGGTVRVFAAMGAYSPTTVYTILTATGGRTGFFDGATSNFAFLAPTLTYDPNNVYLALERNSIDFASIGITPNQISAGRGLEALGMGNPMVNAALLLTPEQARAAFNSVSGEIHPSLHTLMLDESHLVRDAILGRQRESIGTTASAPRATAWANEDDDGATASSYARKARKAKAPKWPIKAAAPAAAPVYSAWVQGYGNWTRLNGDGNAATLQAASGGAIGGVDVTLNHTWRFGFATGGGRSDARVDARRSSGTIDTFHLAAYGAGSIGDILFRTGAAYSHHDVATARTIAFPGFADFASAKYGASTAQVFGEAAYRMVRNGLSAEAFADLAHVRIRSDGFAENGGPAALTVAQAETSATFTTLGLRAQAPVPFVNAWAVTARGSLGWQHAFNAAAPTTAMAFAASAAPFAIAGVPLASDMLLVEAGLDAMVARNARVSLLYAGRLAADASAHAVKANLAVAF